MNTARGGVMAENDLYDALQNDIIGGAAVDTLVVEPMEEDCILIAGKELHYNSSHRMGAPLRQGKD